MTPTTPALASSPTRPLLSICVPTYNRAHLLRVMLQAALPQVKECGNLVELWVSDNASSDYTADVVQASRILGPLSYSRNASNLGSHGNFVTLTTKLARGEYVWLLGDDDLLMPGAVARVLKTLQVNPTMDSFYANFQRAAHRTDWPQESFGGYKGGFQSLWISSTQDRRVDMWQEFLCPETQLCTAMFSQIVRRRAWVDYWGKRPLAECSEVTLSSVFPHCVMFANTLMRKPSYYIGQPVLTCFAGAQNYGGMDTAIWAYCYPQLLRLYHQKGLTGTQLNECVHGVFRFCFTFLEARLRDESQPPWRTLLTFLRGGWRYPAAWIVLAQAVRKAEKPRLLDVVLRTLAQANRSFPIVDPWKWSAR